MPRRIPDYPDAFSGWNQISSLGSIISVIATILFGYIIYDIFANEKISNSNPWAVLPFFTATQIKENKMGYQPTNTLEWTLASPIPFHAFKMLPLQS
jgi:heme/copper-type cytochrome/quinol oxidase subunit 1